MNVTNSHTASETAYSGPLSPSLTVLLAVFLCVVFAWSLYRERFVLGARTTLGFAALRFLSLAAILWLLLAPTKVIVETSTTKRTVAIVTDTSASMATIDPPGTADQQRWVAASSNTQGDEAISSADRAVCALGIADRELAKSIVAIKQHRSDDEVSKRISATQRAIERARLSVEEMRDNPITSTYDATVVAEFEPLLKNAWRLLTGPEFEEYAILERRLASGRLPPQADWRESLSDLQYRLRTTRQVLLEMASVLAQAPDNATARTQQTSRLSRVLAFLKTFRGDTLRQDDDAFEIQWSRFDKTPTLLKGIDGIQESVNSELAAGDEESADTESRNLATNLTEALESLRASDGQIPIAAAFVLTDVGHNDTGVVISDDDTTLQNEQVRSPVDVAGKLGDTPIYVVPIGNSNRLRDINLVGVDAPSVAMRNDDIVIETHLEAYQCGGESCTVKLMADAEIVDFREVEFDADFSSRTIQFQRRVSEVGKKTLSVVVDAVDGEMTQANNLRKITVNVTRDRIRVLLADEMPRWEFRYLAQLFRRDAKIQCDEMLWRPRLITTGNRAETRTLPTTVDQWDEYDVVILGDLPPEHFPVAAQESLTEYLSRRGGNVVLIAGTRAMPGAFENAPLGQILPVTRIDESTVPVEGYAFQTTQRGRSHVALMIGDTQQTTQTAWDFINRFSPLHEVSDWRRPKPSARSLISVVRRGQDEPSKALSPETFLCWQPIGRGRVIYLSGPDTYRLRFLRGDRYHHRFWGKMLRWAIASDLGSGSKMVRVRTNKTDYELGQDVSVEVRLSAEDETPIEDVTPTEIILQVNSGDTVQQVELVADLDEPGLYRGVIASASAGVYRAEPVGPLIDSLPADKAVADMSVSFTVQANLPMELADTRCNRVLASQISLLTGGQVLPPTAVAEALALTDLTPIVTESIQQTPLWAQWKFLWLVFGCWQIEWIVRKWRGFS